MDPSGTALARHQCRRSSNVETSLHKHGGDARAGRRVASAPLNKHATRGEGAT